MTIPQAFELALQHHRAGRLAGAEAIYRQILAVQPKHADALHYLGGIAHQAGRYDLAVEWIRRAIAVNSDNSHAYSNLGEAYRALGQRDEAIAAYRRAIELKPDYAEAHNNLGHALRELGQLDEAAAAYRRALQLKPDDAEVHVNLGDALRERGQLDEAIAVYRRALQLKPGCAEVYNNLGNALREHGQPDEAVSAFRRALQLKPGQPEIYVNLGIALQNLGRIDEAIMAHNRALQIKPSLPEAHVNLGNALNGQGRIGEAMAAFHRAIELKPDYAEAHYNLGNALRDRGQIDQAIAAYGRALELKPEYAEGHINLGNVLRDRGLFVEAIASHRRALEFKPGYAEGHINLGNALRDAGQLDEAAAAYGRALELKPGCAEAHYNLGAALRDGGQLDEANAAFRRALELKPEHAGMHSNLIFALYLQPGQNARTISEEHERWNRKFSDPSEPFALPHANDRRVKRRLRVGYVSPDFRDHAVGRYVLPLFERHDRERFEVLCYSEIARPDGITERLRARADEWRNTAGVPDARLAEMIREDGVDILVDLAMHTAGNRLPVFARKPAPVQVTWLAYAGSAGLPGIGYRLTDARLDPPGSRSRGTAWSAEEPVRLPDCWCCYQPVDESPAINALPALSAGGVTFGSLNNFAKVNDGVLALWARVLEAVKGSRLSMLCPRGRTQERVWALFGARGIAAERVDMVDFLPRGEYLALYRKIDLARDPFPYSGMTTTCDALWMGAPVLTLPGEMPVSRASLSILTSVGLGELAAWSEEDYVRMAVELAGNLPRLAELRATMRGRMKASPLMDAERFARNVEATYVFMWERWRASGG